MRRRPSRTIGGSIVLVASLCVLFGSTSVGADGGLEAIRADVALAETNQTIAAITVAGQQLSVIGGGLLIGIGIGIAVASGLTYRSKRRQIRRRLQ